MSNNIKEFLLKECIQILDRKDVKDEFKKIMKPVIDMLMQEIYPYIFISILLVLISYLLILGIFILLLRSKLIINALKKI